MTGPHDHRDPLRGRRGRLPGHPDGQCDRPAGEYCQTFTVSVDNTPRFRSKGKATVVTGQPFTYPVTTEYGYPYRRATATPSLPARITLTDNGNGTGVLSGTPAPGTGGLYLIYLTATNGIGNPVTQSFNLLVNQPPVISAANTDSITAGVAMTPLTVSATGYPTPTLTATGPPSGSGWPTGSFPAPPGRRRRAPTTPPSRPGARPVRRHIP